MRRSRSDRLLLSLLSVLVGTTTVFLLASNRLIGRALLQTTVPSRRAGVATTIMSSLPASPSKMFHQDIRAPELDRDQKQKSSGTAATIASRYAESIAKSVGSMSVLSEASVVDLTGTTSSSEDSSNGEKKGNRKQKGNGKKNRKSKGKSTGESPVRKKAATSRTAAATTTSTTTGSNRRSKGSKAAATSTSKQPKHEPDRHEKSRQLSLASYNVWFGPHSGPLHDDKRMEGLVDALRQQEPHLIGLQEVTPELAAILGPLFLSVGYHLAVVQGTAQYGCAIAVHNEAVRVIDSGFSPYQTSQMGRGILWALVEVTINNDNKREVLFTTTHLESYIGPNHNGSSERVDQAKELALFCEYCLQERPSTSLAVITGDLNWDDERARSTGMDPKLLGNVIDASRWKDSWKESHPSDPGYTYDGQDSPMLGGKLRRRFDRCLLHSRNNDQIQVDDALLIGKEALPGLTWRKPPHPMARSQAAKVVQVTPSDHFGLVATVNMDSSD